MSLRTARMLTPCSDESRTARPVPSLLYQWQGTNHTRGPVGATSGHGDIYKTPTCCPPVPLSPAGDTKMLQLQPESRHIKDGHDGLGVADLPVPDAGQHLRQGPRHHLDELVGLPGVAPRLQVPGPEEMD